MELLVSPAKDHRQV
ncbi:uncharacterized protein M6B38_279370 [Iris pallida]|uniref:Uncharacterized protein n=1 Tax=Iris pallida TaxID=29817 RepID=A0AAX6HZT4_IRIPA|nr:uncharacterized protein M6B38_279370 [Iris pallida]